MTTIQWNPRGQHWFCPLSGDALGSRACKHTNLEALMILTVISLFREKIWTCRNYGKMTQAVCVRMQFLKLCTGCSETLQCFGRVVRDIDSVAVATTRRRRCLSGRGIGLPFEHPSLACMSLDFNLLSAAAAQYRR